MRLGSRVVTVTPWLAAPHRAIQRHKCTRNKFTPSGLRVDCTVCVCVCVGGEKGQRNTWLQPVTRLGLTQPGGTKHAAKRLPPQRDSPGFQPRRDSRCTNASVGQRAPRKKNKQTNKGGKQAKPTHLIASLRADAALGTHLAVRRRNRATELVVQLEARAVPVRGRPGPCPGPGPCPCPGPGSGPGPGCCRRLAAA